MNHVYEKLVKTLTSVQAKVDFKPEIAIVLGSGLGDYAKDIEIVCELPYSEIDGFPTSTVVGHDGKFIFGYVEKKPVVCMKGRVHYYEGYDISDVVLPIRLMGLLGAKILFLTNASGGINQSFKAGDFMLITDHISMFTPNPLIGKNIEELGTRFPDMSSIYDESLQQIIKQVAISNEIDLKEGVYAQLTGPSFESPAEIRFLQKMDVDAVGMSTVIEAIVANHMGMKVCGISCVCNLAAGLSNNPLTHDEVQEAASIAAPKFKKLLTESVKKF
ncbi:MAG: purine-nucleoside phosphorylase [Lachnospiraceae bacterium]